MRVVKGKKESVEGPVKSFFMGLGIISLFLALGGFINGDVGMGLFYGGIGIGVIAIASRFKNKTRITL